MKIHLLNDKTAVLFGADTRCVQCDTDGTLHIGVVDVIVSNNKNCALPKLSDGLYNVTFECSDGLYKIGTHTARNGYLSTSKKHTETELALLLRVEALERTVSTLTAQVNHLVERFDTNSLNYIITGDN